MTAPTTTPTRTRRATECARRFCKSVEQGVPVVFRKPHSRLCVPCQDDARAWQGRVVAHLHARSKGTEARRRMHLRLTRDAQGRWLPPGRVA